MQPLVSIIMPVYNTGNILNNTVDSILKQTFSNYELIIIDDGSNKKTADLCDYISQNDERVKVVHKKNGGTCAARNIGINMANGKYITFCDHDDIYDANILANEIELITHSCNSYDMAIVGALHIYDNGKKEKYGEEISISTREDIEKNAAKIFKSGMLVTVWNILYSRELIGQTRFNENLRKGHEDIIFNIELYKKASSLISTDKTLYYHYIRKSMSTSAKFHLETADAMKIANNKIYDLCSEIIDKIGNDDYIDLQGEYMRTYTAYLGHLNCSFADFKKRAEGLLYIPVKFSWIDMLKHRNKNTFSFYCVVHKKIYLLYLFMMFNNYLKRK